MSAGAPLQSRFAACPLCAAPIARCAPRTSAACSSHPLFRPELPALLHWLSCLDCGHIFTESHWTRAGEELLFGAGLGYQLPDPTQSEQLRALWAPVVRRVGDLLGADAAPRRSTSADAPLWVDVGFGSGGLLLTAAEFGYATLGIDVRQVAVARLAEFGIDTLCSKFEDATVARPAAVLSLCDVLEHIADPPAALVQARRWLRPGGLLFVSCPNAECSTWRLWDAAGTNPYWGELEHYHNFSRTRLVRLLHEQGFEPIDYYVSSRYFACMDLVARRAP